MKLRRRSEEPAREKHGRSPLGMSHHGDERVKDLMKAHRVSDADSLRESARATVVVERRAQTPILTPNLQTLMQFGNQDWTLKGLPQHTLESFLSPLQEHAILSKAAHQNEAPHDPMEQDLHYHPGRSHGAPSSGHCQEGRQ